jgi:diguanylate cyclase (GGDEF)-like protein
MKRLLILKRRNVEIAGETSTILGVAMIVMLWFGIYFNFKHQAESDYLDALENDYNLALVFEENTLRSIGEVDKTIVYLRSNIEAHLGTIDFHHLAANSDILSEMIIQVSIIDANGILRATSSSTQPAKPIDLSDREHFKFHVHNTRDELFVSKPVVGRVSGKWSIQLTRRFVNKDGSFAGVIVASLDPVHFTEFYRSIHLGPSGSISLVGFDGIVRASGGSEGRGRFQPGQDLSQTRLIREIREHENGTFIDREFDNKKSRIVTFCRVRGHPLAVSLSVTEEQVYADTMHELMKNSIVGVCLTIVILAVCLRGLSNERRLRQTQSSLSQKSNQLRLTLNNMTQGIMLVTKDLDIPVLNEQAVRLLELPEEFLHNPPKFDDLVHHQAIKGEFERAAVPEGTTPLEYFTRRDSQGAFETYERARPNGSVLEVRTTALSDGGFVRTFTDITGRKQAQAAVTRLASEDALTGLGNRRLFRDELEKYAQPQYLSQGFALLLLDLDRFKIVNDTLGHPVGDMLLQVVADRLRNSVRMDNIVARLGGDEFAILLPGATSTKQPEALAERLIEVLSRPYEITAQHIIVGISIGIALAPHDATDPDLLLKAGDMALYAAKAAGRGTYKFFHTSMAEQVRVKRQVEMDLRQAIDNKELELHYQPSLNLKLGTIRGVEALMRWRHPTKGLISPIHFIPVAEETGLIVPIGAWAIKTACLQVKTWSADLKVAVNVSSMQFRSGNLVPTVRNIVADTDFPPERLELEITESVLMQDSQATIDTLHELRALGIKIAMDDFGTGFSSLSYLRSFPLDKIKIDRSFVKDLGASSGDEVIIRSVIEIAKTLNMTTTAEGVETSKQLNQLRDLGCDEAQGYCLSKPLAIDQLPDFIARWSKEATMGLKITGPCPFAVVPQAVSARR